MRPVLSPALRRLWRDDTTLQLGVDPRHAVVLAGVVPEVARLLDLLDGTRDEAAVLQDAAVAGVDPADVSETLALLRHCRALDDAGTDHTPLARLPLTERDRLAPDLLALSLTAGGRAAALERLSRRRAATVEVVGAGRVGALVAMLVAAAGVGRVLVDDVGVVTAADLAPGGFTPAQLDRPRGSALRELLRSTFPGVATSAEGARPDLVVSCPRSGHAAAAGDVVHLVATVRETVGSVGPLVVPGRTCCLHCLDLHRADRDPAWPALRAQLDGAARGESACDTALATSVAAAAVAAVTSWVDTGSSELLGATLELSQETWRGRRRSWRPHADCGCIRREDAAA